MALPGTKEASLAPLVRPRQRLSRNAGGLCAVALGVLSFALAGVSNASLWAKPDWRLTVPFLVAAVVAATASVLRQERPYALALGGVGLAMVSVVAGWFLLTMIVIGITFVVIVILQAVS